MSKRKCFLLFTDLCVWFQRPVCWLKILYPDGPCKFHAVLGLENGFQSVPHFPCGVIYPCSILKFSPSYFCTITEGNRVATRLPSTYLNLQSFLLSGNERRPELISQIPNLGWQQVGMKNIFRVGRCYLLGWKIIQWDIMSRKHHGRVLKWNVFF